MFEMVTSFLIAFVIVYSVIKFVPEEILEWFRIDRDEDDD